MSEIMLILSQKWIIGYSVFASICVIGYLLHSILLVISCRKVGYNVSVAGMIPIVNVFILIKRLLWTRKTRVVEVVEEEEFEL